MKKIGIIIIAVTFLGLTAISIENYKKLLQSQKNQTKPTSKEDAIIPPVPIDSTGVVSLGLNYVFSGRVKEFKPEGSTDSRLILNTVNEAFPTFIITENTTFVKIVDKKPVPIDKDSLKEGDNVRVSAIYGMKTNKWTVGRVFLVEDQSLNTSSRDR